MAYSLEIGLLVSSQLVELDEIGAELMFTELLTLTHDPLRGTEMERVGDLSRRLLLVGRLGAVVYEVDERRKVVTAVDLINALWE